MKTDNYLEGRYFAAAPKIPIPELPRRISMENVPKPIREHQPQLQKLPESSLWPWKPIRL